VRKARVHGLLGHMSEVAQVLSGPRKRQRRFFTNSMLHGCLALSEHPRNVAESPVLFSCSCVFASTSTDDTFCRTTPDLLTRLRQ